MIKGNYDMTIIAETNSYKFIHFTSGAIMISSCHHGDKLHMYEWIVPGTIAL